MIITDNDIHTHTHMYTYKHQHNHHHIIATRIIRSRLRELPYLCTTLRTTIPKLVKPSNTSGPFTLPFLVTLLIFVLPPSIYHNGPNQSCHSLTFCCASSKSYITFQVPHSSPRAPSTFLFPNQFPRLETIKEKTRKSQEEYHKIP